MLTLTNGLFEDHFVLSLKCLLFNELEPIKENLAGCFLSDGAERMPKRKRSGGLSPIRFFPTGILRKPVNNAGLFTKKLTEI